MDQGKSFAYDPATPMATPGFQEMFLPFLKTLSDGETHHMRAIAKSVADQLQLTEEDLKEMIPSGQSNKLANRVGWARTHLNKAGLIERESWGNYRITDAGKQILANPPEKLNLKFFDTIPRHREWFHAPKKTALDNPDAETAASRDEPPNERIEEAVEELNGSLANELLEHIATMDPFRFEQVVLDLLFAMGYGGSRDEAAQVTKKTGDEGIDGERSAELMIEHNIGVNKTCH